MKRKYKGIIAITAAVLCLGVLGFLWSRPVGVEAEAVGFGPLVKEFTVQARLLPVNSMVLTADASGNVAELPFQAGAKVEKGALLLAAAQAGEVNMELQQEQLRQQLNEARQEYDRLYGENGQAHSAFAAAESRYLLAQRNYENGSELAGGGYISPSELEGLKTEREVAYQVYLQAKEEDSQEQRDFCLEQIRSCQRQLETALASVSPGGIYMPYDGVLWEVYTEEGAFLAQNQAALKVYRSGEMKLSASVLAEDAALLARGDRAMAVYPDGSRVQAEVAFVSRTGVEELSSTGLQETRSVVELVPESLPEQMGAGQQADVTFSVIKAERVLTVPSTALVPEGMGNLVYVIDRGRARAAAVETGMTVGGRVEVCSGLETGWMIVSDPYEEGIKPGTRVAGELATEP